MQRDPMHAMTHLGVRIWQFVRRLQSPVDWLPGLALVIRSERAGRGDGDKNAARVARIQQDRVQAHPAGARLPEVALGASQRRQLLPGKATVLGTKQCRVFSPGIHRVRIGERWFQVPHAFELPRMLGAVVPLVRAWRPLVAELVTHGFPRLAAILGSLDLLPEPTTGLRGIYPVRVDRRAFQVIDLPPSKVRTGNIPFLAFAVRGQYEGALFGADQ